MGTYALPIVIEFGKGEERGLDFLPEDIIIDSVLSWLSLFTVIQVLTSSVYFCMERKRARI